MESKPPQSAGLLWKPSDYRPTDSVSRIVSTRKRSRRLRWYRVMTVGMMITIWKARKPRNKAFGM